MVGFGVNVVVTELSGKMRLKSEFEPPATDVIEWLRSVVPRSGRVLFEESGDETDFVYGDSYLGSFLPHLTGHQLIGGPINLYNDRHHFAEFHSGLLFKRGIWRFTDEELSRYFDLYNIVAIVAFHPRSLERLTALQGLLVPVERSANVVLFRVNREPGWFLSGSGRVEAGLNRLECTGVSGAEVVLKYHWLEGLRSEPDVRIEPVRLLDDPIPFIKIINPPSRLLARAIRRSRARAVPGPRGGTRGSCGRGSARRSREGGRRAVCSRSFSEGRARSRRARARPA
jgi:hypothetical protein